MHELWQLLQTTAWAAWMQAWQGLVVWGPACTLSTLRAEAAAGYMQEINRLTLQPGGGMWVRITPRVGLREE